ncbi:MAG: extracellular solute-binding protein [Hydrococcus sp. Prado102]|jgi:putative spermidine/putrescine transport system substrate-binding protein|nr:extracellular solute-binding protein [Hydrococcus sp. Prado102]
MLSRRSFLIGSATIAIAQGLSGCSDGKTPLNVLLLKGSIPPQLIGAFNKQMSSEKTINFKPEAQLKDILSLLENWQQKPEDNEGLHERIPFINRSATVSASLVTLGDYWLKEAIAKKLIEPLNVTDLTGWQQLPRRWQTLVKRDGSGNLDENGQIWGAPYRWGSTIMAYRQDKFDELGWKPSDWGDLWREELRDRISLLDNSREIIGLTLKKLGHSYNEKDLSKIPNLRSQLLALQKQVKLYSSDRYLEPLILGDTWLAVGWSSDILGITSRYNEIKAVVPRSGTSLWSDVWVKPTLAKETSDSADKSALLKKWIDFCWRTQSASQISLYTNAASPRIFELKANELPKDIRNNPLLLVDASIFDKSDFLYPLSDQTQKQYEQLWKEMRERPSEDKEDGETRKTRRTRRTRENIYS